MKLLITVIVLLSALSTTASATEGLYWGIGVGQSYSSVCPGDNATFSCATTGDSFAAIGGYNFTPNWGVEVNYDVLGTYAAYQAGASSDADGSATAHTKVTALTGAATWSTQIYKNNSFIGKLGMGSFFIEQPGISVVNTQTNTNIIYGLGFQHEFTKSFTGRAQWENFGYVGIDSTGKRPMSLMSFDLVFKY